MGLLCLQHSFVTFMILWLEFQMYSQYLIGNQHQLDIAKTCKQFSAIPFGTHIVIRVNYSWCYRTWIFKIIQVPWKQSCQFRFSRRWTNLSHPQKIQNASEIFTIVYILSEVFSWKSSLIYNRAEVIKPLLHCTESLLAWSLRLICKTKYLISICSSMQIESVSTF